MNNGGLGVAPSDAQPPGSSSDAAAFDYDASLAPPVEMPTKVPGMMYMDFSPTPVLAGPMGVAPAPASAAQTFGPPSQGAPSGGPCLIEPEDHSLYPRNWLRPRFRWIAPQGQTLFEVRVHAANQANDLVVYTTDTQWTMDFTTWSKLRDDSYDEAMTVTVRGSSGTAVSIGSSVGVAIAPVAAPGAIVYWTTTNGTALKGFRIGDEQVETVLTPPQVQQYNATATCVGCHTATPDGQFAAFTIQQPWRGGLANIQPMLTGNTAPWLGAAAAAFLQSNTFGINTFSAGHWAPGDRVEVSMFGQAAQLIWINLEAAQQGNVYGTIARTGDTNNAGAPSWSHDGQTIAYVSLMNTQDGRLNNGPADIYTVPYNNRQGGNAAALAGASDPAANEYYPAFTPDDQYIFFSKTTGNYAAMSMYNNLGAEVNVVPAAGGNAKRLVANDPPSCTMQASPGVANSWPKTAPEVGTALDGRKFYWVIFSSHRDPLKHPQLYVTPLVTQGQNLATYGALYLWNQPEMESNHTPAWENFRIPPVPPRMTR
jgi:hypothetical protein